MSFTLSTFNVHMGGLLPHGAGAYDLGAATRLLNCDVRVFQEIFDAPDEPTDLFIPAGHSVRELVYNSHFLRPHWPQALDRAQLSRIGSWKLVVSTGLPILEERVIDVPAIGSDKRTSVLALHLESSEGPFWLVAVHLATAALPVGSIMQLAALKGSLPEGPCVIAGDHNLWRGTAQRILGRNWRNAVRGGTWPAHRPVHHIDHVWMRGIHGHGHIERGLGSDHLPVTASLHLDACHRRGK